MAASPRRADTHRARWHRRLVGLGGAVGGAGATAAGAALLGAPEVAALAVVVGIAAGAALVRTATRPITALAASIEAAREGGVTPDVPEASSGVGRDLARALGEALSAAEQGRQDRDARLSALEALVRHADVALLAYDADGRVLHMNLSARQLLGTGHLSHLGDLPADFGALADILATLAPGDHRLVEGDRAGVPYAITVRGTAYAVGGRRVTAAALVNVRVDLEAREAEAWATLTRVLTHEIANSAGPIASLAETAARRLDRGDPAGTRDALATIQRRSDALVRFIESYRAVARVPAPVLAPVNLGALTQDVATLFLAGRAEIRHEVSADPPDLVAHVDAGLVEQALINLVRNALQAVEGQADARIEIAARVGDRSRVHLSVTDNGPGIPAEALSRVFVPFFTTRDEGSGVGLALCQQIARVHGGRIEVASRPGCTTLTLVL